MVGLAQPVYAFHYNITHNGRLFRPNHRPIPTVVVSRHLFAFFSAARRGAAPCECDDGRRVQTSQAHTLLLPAWRARTEPRAPAGRGVRSFRAASWWRGAHHLTPPPVAIARPPPARPVPTTATAYPHNPKCALLLHHLRRRLRSVPARRTAVGASRRGRR